MKKILLSVKGMHCKSCEILIIGELEELEGVGDVHASSAKNEIMVEIDEFKADLSQIKKIVEGEGFRVKAMKEL